MVSGEWPANNNLTLSAYNVRTGASLWTLSLPPSSSWYPRALYSTFADAVDVATSAGVARYAGDTGKLVWQQPNAKELLLLGAPDRSLIIFDGSAATDAILPLPYWF